LAFQFWQFRRSVPLPTLFFELLLQTKALTPIDARVAPAWPLGDAWVALGWPKGHPIPIPNPIPVPKFPLRSFASFAVKTLCWQILDDALKRIKCESGQWLSGRSFPLFLKLTTPGRSILISPFTLFDFRYYIAYIVPVTEANGAPGKIIYLGACLIAAVRLAREEKWDNSPRVAARIGDAIILARRIYDRMKIDFPHM